VLIINGHYDDRTLHTAGWQAKDQMLRPELQ